MERDDWIPEDDLFVREEKCQKAIRTVTKAIFMRLVIAGLMLWVVASNPKEVWAWGLAAFVMLITATGMIPLLQERKKQKNLLQTLIEQEEN